LRRKEKSREVRRLKDRGKPKSKPKWNRKERMLNNVEICLPRIALNMPISQGISTTLVVLQNLSKRSASNLVVKLEMMRSMRVVMKALVLHLRMILWTKSLWKLTLELNLQKKLILPLLILMRL
jgi:hypothetical protein